MSKIRPPVIVAIVPFFPDLNLAYPRRSNVIIAVRYSLRVSPHDS